MTKETAIDILESQKSEHYKEEINEALDMAISALKGFAGMTNGEVIQALFPNADYESRANFMHITSANICGVTFFWDWWNAPYQKGGEEV